MQGGIGTDSDSTNTSTNDTGEGNAEGGHQDERRGASGLIPRDSPCSALLRLASSPGRSPGRPPPPGAAARPSWPATVRAASRMSAQPARRPSVCSRTGALGDDRDKRGKCSRRGASGGSKWYSEKDIRSGTVCRPFGSHLPCDHLIEHDPKAPHIRGRCGRPVHALGGGVCESRNPAPCRVTSRCCSEVGRVTRLVGQARFSHAPPYVLAPPLAPPHMFNDCCKLLFNISKAPKDTISAATVPPLCPSHQLQGAPHRLQQPTFGPLHRREPKV